MHDLVCAIKEKIEAEKMDHASYWELAGMAASCGHNDYAAILRDIARDEESHHEHLMRIMAEIKNTND